MVERFAGPDSFIAAADSGYDSAVASGFTPQVLVGDMDSIHDADAATNTEGLEVLSFDTDKDHTDTELLFALVTDRGLSPTVLVGGGCDGRMDHELAILAMFERSVHPDVWINDRAEMYCVESNTHTHPVRQGRTVSVFPVGEGPWHIESTGLKWPLHDLSWSRSTVGVSNEAVVDRISVTVHTGRLLIVYPYQDS